MEGEFWKIAKKNYSIRKSIQDLNQQFFLSKKLKIFLLVKFSLIMKKYKELKVILSST